MYKVVLPLAAAILTIGILPTRANDAYSVNHTMDFFVVVEEAMIFTVETDLCPDTEDFWCAAPPFTDSVLWLYDESGTLFTFNDDDPRKSGQSWNSYIEVELQTGVYRLRAGRFFCIEGQGCLNPTYPFPEGGIYTLSSNMNLLLDPNPPTESIPPVPSELPSEEPSIVIPTIEPSPEMSIEPSPSQEPSIEPTPTPSPTPRRTPTPEPTLSPSPSPDPTIVPSVQPSVEPTPEPSSPIDTPEEAVVAAAEAVGEAVAAVGEAAAGAVKHIADLGKDLDVEEKKKAQPVAVALVVSQVASAAAAAATFRKGKE